MSWETCVGQSDGLYLEEEVRVDEPLWRSARMGRQSPRHGVASKKVTTYQVSNSQII